MDKQRTDELIRKLVENRLTKSEFEEFISKMGDQDKAVFFESSLKDHFEETLKLFQEKASIQKVEPNKIKGG